MGRQQQQFQVLKGAVRQALLRRFHISPPRCSSSFLAREALASEGAEAAALRKVGGRDGVRLLSSKASPIPHPGPGSSSGSGSGSSSSAAAAAPLQGHGNLLNPCTSSSFSSSSIQDLHFSRRAFERYFSSSSSTPGGTGVVPKVEGLLDQEILNHSSSPCLTTTATKFSAPLRDFWAAAYFGTSSPFWPVRVSALLAANKTFPDGLLSSSSSRGFSSLAEKSLGRGQKPDSAAAGQERGGAPPAGGGGREGQGGDEGVSASVSGREVVQFSKKQQRKKRSSSSSSSSVIHEVELPRRSSSESSAEESAAGAGAGAGAVEVAAAEGTTSAPRRALSELLDAAANGSSSSSDNGVLKPSAQRGGARRKRSREIAGENILLAFNENAEAPPMDANSHTHAHARPQERVSIRKKENVSSFVSEVATAEKRMPLENSSLSSHPEESAEKPMPESIITTADGISEGNFGGLSAYRESGHLGGRNNGVDRGQHLEEAAAVVQKPVEEVLRKDTFNSAAVEVPAISARTDPIRATGTTHDIRNIIRPELVRTAAAAAANTANETVSSSAVGIPPEGDAEEFSDPKALYRALLESKGGRIYQNQEKSKLNIIFYRFAVSGWVSDQALSLYINSKFFPSAASKFRKFFMHKSSQDLRSSLISKGGTNKALQSLFPLFAEFCIHQFPNEINRYRELVHTADMTKPDAWYPFARAIKRKIIYHKGPTNSGKTYNALKRFMESPTGIYCSPLRLLAMEVFDTVNLQGVYCNLHTGQEKRDVPFAKHLACTIEMCYLTTQWDVAVIDEIQMMSDEYRGWAWTRAFLGLQADEIHVCGDPSALPLIRNLCSGTGDDLVEYEYERFKPLKVAEESLRGDFRNIEAGDCIVAFSRRDIFDIKREVELATKHRCCVVYGALPPETRTQQAKLFNEVDNGYDVLVASDAIGMGLNLNIRRVVFFSLDKFDGDSKKPVAPAQVKQIAGRAGRRGSLYPEGVTTTFFSQDLPYLSSSMLQDFQPSTAAGLFPVFEQVELFASQLPTENFAKLLERFSETCKLDGAFFLSRYDNLKRVANMLEKVKGLSLEDRFNFCFAPVNVRDPQSMGALYRYATAFSQKIPVHVEMGVPSSSARDEFELLDLEARHQVLSMYLWLSQHFPGDLFPQREQAGEMASQIAVLLGQSLVQSSRRWSKRKLFQPQYRGSRPFANPRNSRPDSGSSSTWSSSSTRQSTGPGPGWVDAKPEPVEIFVRA